MSSLSVVSMFGLFCAMAGGVTPALRAGGFVGQFALPGISDIPGPKLVAIPRFAATTIALRLFIATDADRTRPIATEAAPAGVGVCLFLKEMTPHKVSAHRPAPVTSV
jgi:hypothetical protein